MNRNQLIVFSAAFFLLAMLMMSISIQWKGYCNVAYGRDILDLYGIQACVRGDIFAPWPYFLLGLSTACIVAAFLADRRKA